MRIAIDLSPAIHQKAGLGRYARTLAEHLVTQGNGNAYIAFAYGRFTDDALSPALRALPRAHVPLDARPWRMGVWLAHALGVGLDRWLPRADIFHATEHLLPPLKNAKTVFTLHDLIFRLFPEYHLPLNHWFLTNAMPHFLRRADAIIAVSECTKRDAISNYQLPPEKITVIYEGVNPALRPENDLDRIAEARARYANHQPFLFFVSTIEPRKNIIALVDALRVLRAHGHSYRLLIAGRKGWLYQPTFDHVKRTGMSDAVGFLDYVPDADLPALFAACEAFVFPSLYEGFGLPVLEAMACGAPVICSNMSSLPEIAGDAALLVNPRGVGEIAAAIERVIGDANLRAELRAKGLARAAQFSWERAARETSQVYRRVMATR
jgi:glycosyltransferase involved in cell wall biosynthesis